MDVFDLHLNASRSIQFYCLRGTFQFMLHDENAEFDAKTIDESMPMLLRDLFAVTPGVIHIGTVRDMNVSVTVEIHDCEPEINASLWQQINECSVDIPSGSIVVMGTVDYPPTAPRIKVFPGTYQARLLYSGLDTLSFDGLDGDDKYEILLWLGSSIEPLVLKQRSVETLHG